MRDNMRHKHKTFSPIEEKMIMYFNTCNLVFKDTYPNPNMFKGKCEDRWCIFTACEGRDHYHHVRYQCYLYTTKYRDIQVAHHICVFLRNLNWSQSYWIYFIWLPLVWQLQNRENHLCRSKLMVALDVVRQMIWKIPIMVCIWVFMTTKACSPTWDGVFYTVRPMGYLNKFWHLISCFWANS